ncbi:MAG: hypothetical protein ACE5LU_06385 [Anaerolineae bacterium]
MTRQTAKFTLVTLSLATTLGTWATLAQDDGRPAPVIPEVVVQTLDLPPIPTLVRPPAANGFGGVGKIDAGVPLQLPPIPAVSAPAPITRPIARTRSSR